MPPWLLKSAPTTRSKLKYGIGVPCQFQLHGNLT
jgi:hypothetical protein